MLICFLSEEAQIFFIFIFFNLGLFQGKLNSVGFFFRGGSGHWPWSQFLQWKLAKQHRFISWADAVRLDSLRHTISPAAFMEMMFASLLGKFTYLLSILHMMLHVSCPVVSCCSVTRVYTMQKLQQGFFVVVFCLLLPFFFVWCFLTVALGRLWGREEGEVGLK